MSSRHNDILQDDDEFTSLSATSPTIITISFTITSPAALGYARCLRWTTPTCTATSAAGRRLIIWVKSAITSASTAPPIS